MRTIIDGGRTIEVSDDEYRYIEKEAQEIEAMGLVSESGNIEERITEAVTKILGNDFAEGSKFMTFIEGHMHGRRRGIAVLLAHGSGKDDGWMYEDGDNYHSIQEWIDARDGKFACLFILCCNPEATTVKSKKSLLVFADRETKAGYLDIEERACFSLVHPKEGEIDAYTIDHYIKAQHS